MQNILPANTRNCKPSLEAYIGRVVLLQTLAACFLGCQGQGVNSEDTNYTVTEVFSLFLHHT